MDRFGRLIIQINGSEITSGTQGQIFEKGANWSITGADTQTVPLLGLPDGQIYSRSFILRDHDTGQILVNRKYWIKRADGSYEEGMSGEDGQTHVVTTSSPENIEIETWSI